MSSKGTKGSAEEEPCGRNAGSDGATEGVRQGGFN